MLLLAGGPTAGCNTIEPCTGWVKIRRNDHLSTGDEMFTIIKIFTNLKNYYNMHVLRIILNLFNIIFLALKFTHPY